MKGLSTTSPPIHVNRRKMDKNTHKIPCFEGFQIDPLDLINVVNQNSYSYKFKKKKFFFFKFMVNKTGKTKIKTEKSNAITPPNLLGIERKIA